MLLEDKCHTRLNFGICTGGMMLVGRKKKMELKKLLYDSEVSMRLKSRLMNFLMM